VLGTGGQRVEDGVEVCALLGDEFDCGAEDFGNSGHQVDVKSAVVWHPIERGMGRCRTDSERSHGRTRHDPRR